MDDTFNTLFADLDHELPSLQEVARKDSDIPQPEDTDAALFKQALVKNRKQKKAPPREEPRKNRLSAARTEGMPLCEHEAFKTMKEKKWTPKKQHKKPAHPKSSRQTGKQTDDHTLFGTAMAGVAPLGTRGRQIAPKPEPVTPAHSLRDSEQDSLYKDIHFQVEYTNAFVQAHVQGLDPLVLGKMRAGHYSPEGHLDLHGQNIIQAYASMTEFLRTSYNKSMRCVLLIPGRGKNSPNGYGVLREKVQTWLTRAPFKRVVLAFCTAQPKHGGSGAMYVLLRKFKKHSKKIHWNRTPSDEDLFF